MQRLIIEMGMGVDLHGQDHGKAALRAAARVLQNCSLPVLRHYEDAQIDIRVTIGVQKPEAVEPGAIAALFPRGRVSVCVVTGGMDVHFKDTGDTHVTAMAAAEVFLPPLPSG